MLNKILLSVALVIVAVIISGTLIAFATNKAHPGASLRTIDPTPEESNIISQNSQEFDSFVGLPRIRATTKPSEQDEEDRGTPLVLTLWFPYPKDDTAFYEELSRKSGTMTTLIVSYFAEHTERELRSRGEEKVKKDLLEILNTQLVLGKINSLYFTEYVYFKL